MKDLYKILDISPGASMQEFRESFHYLAFAYHPDRFGNDEHKKRAAIDLKKITDEYKILSDPIKRCEYDRRVGLAKSRDTSTASSIYRSHDLQQHQAQEKMRINTARIPLHHAGSINHPKEKTKIPLHIPRMIPGKNQE